MFRGLKLGEIAKPYHLAEHWKNRDLGVDVDKGLRNRYIASMGASNAGSHTLSPSPFLRWPKLTSTMPTPLATSIHSIRLEPLIPHPVPLSS